MGVNLDELERLHRKAVGGDWRNLPSNMLDEIWGAFPALLALARDGERYRYWRDNHGWTGYFDDGASNSEEPGEVDAAIDAARNGERNGNS